MSEPGCIPFSELPDTSQLFSDYTSSFDRVRQFYSTSPKLNDLAGRNASAYPANRREQLAKILERQNRAFGGSERTFANIERFRRGARAIVTGQQVVLFGGPAYSIYKALTAIKLAEWLTHSTSEHVSIFWLATQDHDFAEVQRVMLRSNQGTFQSFSVSSSAPAGTPVAQIPLGDDVATEAKGASEFLGGTNAAELLQTCYRPGETLGSAIGKLFAKLFASYGLVLIDPSDAELAAIAKPLFESAIESAPELSKSLVARGKELDRAGYHQQVKVTNSSALFFVNQRGIRTAIHLANGGFAIGPEKISKADLIARLASEPQDFSGNALLRPVVQDFLLPTAAYVGGPAEVAYFAQANVVYEKLLGHATPIVPRFSATLLDARDRRLLTQYGLAPIDVVNMGGRLGEDLSRRRLPKDVVAKIEAAEREISSVLPAVQNSLKILDPTLSDAAKHAQSKMSYQLTKLRGLAARAQLCREKEIDRHARVLNSSMLPNGKLQEREIGGVSFLSQFGSDLLSRIHDVVQPECFGHRFIQL